MKRERGFTLIELMFGILVLSILFGLAIPSFKSYTANTRRISATNSLVSALALARSEAVHRSTSVSVCASSDGATCTGTWVQGWIVFSDSNNPGEVDGTDSLLQVWPALNPTVQLTSGADFVQYDARGMKIPLGGPSAVFTVSVTGSCTGSQATTVTVTTSGSPQTQTSTPCP